MSDRVKDFEPFVPAHEMPNCPFCKQPIAVPPKNDHERLMVFHAHGRAALAHDGCHPVEGQEPVKDFVLGRCDRCDIKVHFNTDNTPVSPCGLRDKCEAYIT